MKIAVICSSKTGNTRVLAHALADAFSAPLFSVQSAPENLSAFEALLLGFWCDKGQAPEDMQEFVKKIHGQRVGFFATLGGDPESERAQAWFNATCEALLKAGGDNENIGQFLCCGRIDPEIYKLMLEMSGGTPTPEQEERRRLAETHPDRVDLLNVVALFENALKG